MVQIVDYKKRENSQGEEFFTLIVQSGIQIVKSQETGKSYFTAKKASVSSTFTEEVCKSLLGEKIPGSVRKVKVEPYEYVIEETGEVITLNHHWEYCEEGETMNEIIHENDVLTKESVSQLAEA